MDFLTWLAEQQGRQDDVGAYAEAVSDAAIRAGAVQFGGGAHKKKLARTHQAALNEYAAMRRV